MKGICFCIPFNSRFQRAVNFSQRRTGLLCQNLGGDLFNDYPDVVSSCDEMKKVILDFPNADDVSLACVSVAEASVSTPEDVCNRIKKNLTGFEKDTFLPRVLCQRDNAPPVSVLPRISSAITNSGVPSEEVCYIQYKKSISVCEGSS